MLSKSAEIETNFKKHIVFTDSARSGWQLILESLPSDSTVLLPSYIGITDREGSGIYDPIVQLGLNHIFYHLNDDLSISVDEIESQLSKNNIKVILLVHYFGFKIQNISLITQICQDKGIIVVEDCAHLYSYNINCISDAGTFGDFVFYSLHKNFPITKGGLLVQNNLMIEKIEYSQYNIDYNYLIEFQSEKIALKRIENYKLLDQLLSEIDGVSPFKKLRNGDVPHTYPIVVHNNLREKLYFKLVNLDIPVIALYYRLIDPLTANKYGSMQFISNNILNLPIHQDVEKDDLLLVVESMKESLLELKE